MGKITQKDFSAGFCPNDDFVGGRANGLQAMDNLTLDEMGAIQNVRIPTFINDFLVSVGQAGEFLYSKIINGAVNRYVSFFDGSIRKDNNGLNTFPTVVLAARTTPGKPSFGAGLGQIFIYGTNPNAFLKDDGTTVRNWGINAPAAPPTAVITAGNTTWWGGNVISFAGFTAVEGNGLVTGAAAASANTDATTFRTILQLIANQNLDFFPNADHGADTDTFSISLKIADSSQLLFVTVEFLLETPTGAVNDVTDYYWFRWSTTDLKVYYRSGVAFWNTLKCQRTDFVREGTNNALGWANVKAIRIVFQATATGNYGVASPYSFAGGTTFPLYAGLGDVPIPYQYAQVNVYHNGSYIGKSPLGPASLLYTVINGLTTVTPYIVGIDSQCNECWIYKRGGTLDQWYFVGACAVIGGVVTDFKTDEFYLEVGLTTNTFLASVSSITSPIIAIEGPINGRMALLTATNIYFTDYLNPESYDTRLILTLSGNVGEVNLFLVRINNAQLLAGSTQDIYEISGTFDQFPDGSFDFAIRSLGVRQPPISDAFAVANNMLFYIANDGVRLMFGMLTEIVSQELMNFWRGQSFGGLLGFNIQGGNQIPYRLAVSRNRLVLLMYHNQVPAPTPWGGPAIYEMDLTRKTWTRRTFGGSSTTSPLFFNCYTEEDGTLLTVNIDGLFKIYDGTETDPIKTAFGFQTVCMDGGEPGSRKDLLVLRINMATNGSKVDLTLFNETRNSAFLGSYSTPGKEIAQIIVPVNGNSIDLSRRYALQITDNILNGIRQGVSFFRLTDWTLEYVARPPQTLAVVEYPNNLGTDERKRFYRYAFIVDTLGSIVDVTPSVGGVAYPTQQIQSSAKSTFTYPFEQEVTGYEITNFLKAHDNKSPFEYYGPSLAECITEKMPPLSNFQVIAPNNFGINSLKRVRTLPFVINTFGNEVIFRPIVDGVQVGAVHGYNTTQKQTVYYYFQVDTFGLDYGGTLQCLTLPKSPRLNNDTQGMFEFYGFLQPENVEELPVPKLYDQLGPVQFDRVGKLFEFRVRMIARTTQINYNVIMDFGVPFQDSFITTPNLDTVYTIRLPKGIIGTVCRIELSAPIQDLLGGATNSFFRWYAQLRVKLSGMQTELRWITAAGKVTSGS